MSSWKRHIETDKILTPCLVSLARLHRDNNRCWYNIDDDITDVLIKDSDNHRLDKFRVFWRMISLGRSYESLQPLDNRRLEIRTERESDNSEIVFDLGSSNPFCFKIEDTIGGDLWILF
ncbi:hypothetical protein KQX54_021563 [Cotesia glomerata]|uniref:Uncharacterized protein n=1 Tax=Cotesia glomerata TaxID=32391 RepID=A0AAV7J9I8_COTGL|nr:hypothetical protein KQX54_021563 [Cotesia glomerata]